MSLYYDIDDILSDYLPVPCIYYHRYPDLTPAIVSSSSTEQLHEWSVQKPFWLAKELANAVTGDRPLVHVGKPQELEEQALQSRLHDAQSKSYDKVPLFFEFALKYFDWKADPNAGSDVVYNIMLKQFLNIVTRDPMRTGPEADQQRKAMSLAEFALFEAKLAGIIQQDRLIQGKDLLISHSPIYQSLNSSKSISKSNANQENLVSNFSKNSNRETGASRSALQDITNRSGSGINKIPFASPGSGSLKRKLMS